MKTSVSHVHVCEMTLHFAQEEEVASKSTQKARPYQWNSLSWITENWKWKEEILFYLLMSELIHRNLPACPRNTHNDKTRPLWSEELQSAQHNVVKHWQGKLWRQFNRPDLIKLFRARWLLLLLLVAEISFHWNSAELFI